MKKVLLITAMIFSMSASTMMAQNTKPQTKNISDVSLAWEFAQYGYNNKSALALITAAQILYTVPTTTSAQVPLDAATSEFSSKQLLEDAKTLAKGDQNVLAMITKVEGEKPAKSRGSQAELMAYNFKLAPSAVREFKINYNGGAEAIVTVKSNAAVAPKIAVVDSKGQVVQTTPGIEPNSVKWTPTKNEQYKVTVTNPDASEAKYVFITN